MPSSLIPENANPQWLSRQRRGWKVGRTFVRAGCKEKCVQCAGLARSRAGMGRARGREGARKRSWRSAKARSLCMTCRVKEF